MTAVDLLYNKEKENNKGRATMRLRHYDCTSISRVQRSLGASSTSTIQRIPVYPVVWKRRSFASCRCSTSSPLPSSRRQQRSGCIFWMNVWHVLVIIMPVVGARDVEGFLSFPSSLTRLASGTSFVPFRQPQVSNRYSCCAAVTKPSNVLYMERSTGDEGNISWHKRRRNDTSARRRAINTRLPEITPKDLIQIDVEAEDAATTVPDGSNGEKSTSPNRKPIGGTDRRGLLLLATVPLVWGTYGPSVKYLYQMGESTPALLFNFGCYLVSAASLAAVAWFNDARRSGAEARSSLSEAKPSPPRDASLVNRYAARAGLELGGWLFLGGTAQVWGLELTSASRAAFLVQLTTVIVPVLEAFLGRRKLRPQVWLACALATMGVALVSLGGILPSGINVIEYITGSLSASRLSPTGFQEIITGGNLRGDLLVALSAIFYSLHVVRLGAHVSKVETLSLARAKSVAEVGFSFLSLVVAGFIGGQRENISRYIAALAAKPDLLLVFVAVLVWNGALTSAYAMWAQTRGQAVVAPSEANLVYSLQPLFSTFFAVVVLKESFRGTEMVGAALVLLSLFLATYRSSATKSSPE